MKRKIDSRNRTSTVKNSPKELEVIDPDRRIIYTALAVIVVISIIAYLPVFHNELLNWDDEGYIKNIRQLADHSFNLKDIFSRNVMGNWHPFTMLVYTIEYHLFGLNAAGYHGVNLFLHLVNVILVFYAVYLISDKSPVALVASFLFGIHPLHVESVAWAAELKDLLYTMFFLASYIFYLKYLKEQITNYELRITNRRSAQANYESAHQHISTSAHYYILALALFVFSLLSKAMAASLPLVLILTDYFKGRKIDKKVLLEKAPFFLLAVIFGVVAVIAQKSSNAIQDITIYAFPQRLVFAAYGFVSYLIKLALPVNLSAFYPYPVNSPESIGSIPLQYYAYVLIFLVIAAYIVYSVRFTKKIIFGMGFFTITVLLVLQILPVGKTIMADRYSYIPSIGIFYLAGEGLNSMINPAFAGQVGQWSMVNKIKWSRTIGVALLSIAAVFYSVKTYSRCGVWKNSEIFWSKVIEYDNTLAEAHYNRGIVFMNENRSEEAIRDFNRAIELNPDYAAAYNNRGNVFLHEKRTDEAVSDFNKAIELRPDFTDAYINRGLVFMNEKSNDATITHLNKAIEANPGNAEAYYNRGLIYMKEKKYNEAISDLNKATELNPGYSNAYNNRGLVYMNEKNYGEAIKLFNKAIELDSGNSEAWYNRGTLFVSEKKYSEAINDFNKAIELNPKYAEAYNNRGSVFVNVKRNEEALADFNMAIELNPGNAEAYYNMGLLFMNETIPESSGEAVKAFSKAIELNPGYANAYNNRGIVFVNEKRNSEAIGDFTKVIELQPFNANAYNNRGIIYMNEKRSKEAINDFNHAIELNPNYTGAYVSKANLLFEEKRYEEAVVIYTRVTELMNNYAPAWYRRGLAQYYTGKRSAACDDLNRAAALGYRQAAEALAQICK